MKLIREFENLDVMPTWIKAMKDGQCVIIPDAADIHATQLQERTVYQRFNISSIIAVPFMPNPTGFLVIRNPSRYLSYTTMLTVSAYVLHRAVAQQKTLERTRLTLTPDRIESDKDVIINFFGNMEIYTSKGVLREQDFKSPKSTRVATYLMLHRKATHPPLEIIAALWPDDETDADLLSNSVRGHIYRFRQAFSLISDYQIIETTANGYRINPELHIMTDLQQFDLLWEHAQKAESTSRKIELLQKAFEIYRGHIFENAAGEHWIMSLVTHYMLRYAGLADELLSALAEVKDYPRLQQYAVRAHEIIPDNVKIRYWIVYAMYHLGAIEIAKGEIIHARTEFTAEEYKTFVSYLKQCKELPHYELLG